MLILINPYAGGSTAEKKWKTDGSEILTRLHGWAIHTLNGYNAAAQTIEEALNRGETDFVAAGGDGTVNSVLNHIVRFAGQKQRQNVRLGAVGLGSSNDFHKPFTSQSIHNIPYKLEFAQARFRDVGRLTFLEDGIWRTRYFLVNASCGITAEANRRFNGSDNILRTLKRVHTQSAILYAAIKTILQHRNFTAAISSSEGFSWRGELTNLGILKNPHFSGNLRYDIPTKLDSGKFGVALCEKMRRIDIFRLLNSLSRGKFKGLRRTVWFPTSSITVTADRPFLVETDGEIITTTAARFTVLPHYLKVCP